MTLRAAVVSPWAGSPPTTPHIPEVAIDYPEVTNLEDITGTPASNIKPLPNELTCRLIGPDAVIQTIDADPKYEVLWTQPATPQAAAFKLESEIPTETEKRNSREALTDKGVPRVTAEEITGEKEALNRGAIAMRRIAWQAQLLLAATAMKAILLAPITLAAQTQTAYQRAAGDSKLALSVDLSPTGFPPVTHKAAIHIIRKASVDAIKKAFPVTPGSPVDVLILEPDNRMIWNNESGDVQNGIIDLGQFLIDENLKVIR